jgi:hypothetical protein
LGFEAAGKVARSLVIGGSYIMEQTLNHKSRMQSSIVCFAGSRYGSVPEAAALISALAPQGTSFLVGCAAGIDRSFRQALLTYASRTTVHCAFPVLARQFAQSGLMAVCTVINAPSPAAALHRRTVNMVSDCTSLVLFPDNPRTGTWGRGSTLIFRTAMQQHKRIFVVTAIPPIAKRRTRVVPASLCGVVSGYLVVPANTEAPHAV